MIPWHDQRLLRNSPIEHSQALVATHVHTILQWYSLRHPWHFLLSSRRPICILVFSVYPGGEWRLAGKVLAVRMFIFGFAPTKIELIHSILERYINICPYFPPTLPLLYSYRPPINPLLFCIFSTTSRVWYYRLASFYVRIISEIL